jgi:hypothetical protein
VQTPRDADYCYARIDRIADYLAMGWVVISELGPVHGCYSALAVWLCECRQAKLPREIYE